jgi:hypothetical protein
MSIQAVSNVSSFQPVQSPRSAQQFDVGGAEGTPQSQSFWQQRKADLNQLGQALRAGDTTAAQQAYDALVALGQNGPLRNGETFHRTDRAQDFAAIGQSLASGDASGAKTAFAALAATFRPRVSTVGGLPPGPPTHKHPPTSVGGGSNTSVPNGSLSVRA